MSNSLINSKWWRAITPNKLLRELILWTFLPCIRFIIKYVMTRIFFCSQLWKLKLLRLNCIGYFFIFTYWIRSQHFSRSLLLWILRVRPHIISRWLNVSWEMSKFILCVPHLVMIWRVLRTLCSRWLLLLLPRLIHIHIHLHWMLLEWIGCYVMLSWWRRGLLGTSSGWILLIWNCTLWGLFWLSRIFRNILRR